MQNTKYLYDIAVALQTREPKGLVIPCRMGGGLCCTEVYTSNLPFLDYIISRCFTNFTSADLTWPPVTSHDLWPLPKTIGSFLSTWQTYKPNMKSVHHCYHKISCLQAVFEVFTVCPPVTSDDLWPLPKTIGFFLLTWQICLPKYENCPLLLSWDTVFTRFSNFDLWWPQMTFYIHQKQ